ncbi:hypothetical protein BaRGS_00029043, partial [Batillaria attramentaria]
HLVFLTRGQSERGAADPGSITGVVYRLQCQRSRATVGTASILYRLYRTPPAAVKGAAGMGATLPGRGAWRDPKSQPKPTFYGIVPTGTRRRSHGVALKASTSVQSPRRKSARTYVCWMIQEGKQPLTSFRCGDKRRSVLFKRTSLIPRRRRCLTVSCVQADLI